MKLLVHVCISLTYLWKRSGFLLDMDASELYDGGQQGENVALTPVIVDHHETYIVLSLPDRRRITAEVIAHDQFAGRHVHCVEQEPGSKPKRRGEEIK
jgi:hypothetical protein